MDIKLRKLTIDDLKDILEIEEKCFSVPWSKEAFESEINHKFTYYCCIEINKKVIGYAGLWKIIDEGHITNIAVLPMYRKKGYGNNLIKNLINYCNKNSIVSMTLEVRESNEAAINLYRKNGFEIAGIRPNYYTKPVENAAIMWRKN